MQPYSKRVCIWWGDDIDDDVNHIIPSDLEQGKLSTRCAMETQANDWLSQVENCTETSTATFAMQTATLCNVL